MKFTEAQLEKACAGLLGNKGFPNTWVKLFTR